MSPLEKNIDQVDKGKLDRLVDDELNEMERHELLANLETHPDGWRSCALAFLESQCWRKELGSLLANIVGEPSAEPGLQERSILPKRQWTRRVVNAVAMAASFLIAVWLGWVIQDTRNNAGPIVPDRAELAQSVPASEPVDSVRPSTSDARQRPVSPTGPWQMVTLSAGGRDDQSGQTIDLPACEQHRLDSRWPNSLPPALPLELVESLERAGYRVRRHRELIPMEMEDGRRLVVPVEQVEAQYVGHPSL